MDRDTLLRAVAPCSLLCHTCAGLQDGAISACAAQLHTLLEGYGDYLREGMPREQQWRLEEFETFHKHLARYAVRPCTGCRNSPSGSVCIDGCVVRTCVRRKGVDYCADCDEFPCGSALRFFAAIDSVLAEDWLSGTQRMRKIGLEAYFEERKARPHYLHYQR